MTGLAHPLEDVLGALVETHTIKPRATPADSGWFWMVGLVVGIGLMALVTR